MKRRYMFMIIPSVLYVAVIFFLTVIAESYLIKGPEINTTRGQIILLTFIFTSCIVLFIIAALMVKDHKSSRDLKDKVEQTDAKSKDTNERLFSYSHDLRTPVDAIIGYATLLKTCRNNEQKFNSYIQNIENAASHIIGILEEMKTIPEVKPEEQIINDKDIWDIYELYESIDPLVDNELNAKHIKLNNTISVTNTKVYADDIKIRNIFINLVKAMVQKSSSGGSITMNVKEVPYNHFGYTMFQIETVDPDYCVPQDAINAITNNDPATESTTQEYDYSHLLVVKKLVTILNGTFDIQSQKNTGTSISLLIPMRVARLKQALENEKMKNDVLISDSLFRGKRVLLAEDNDINAEMTIEILKQFGIETDRVSDGNQCVQKYATTESSDYYSLILMDIQMPIMDGYDATKAIRSLTGIKSEIPVIALTANAFKADQENAFETGMNDYLTKPINVNKLAKVLENWINKRD